MLERLRTSRDYDAAYAYYVENKDAIVASSTPSQKSEYLSNLFGRGRGDPPWIRHMALFREMLSIGCPVSYMHWQRAYESEYNASPPFGKEKVSMQLLVFRALIEQAARFGVMSEWGLTPSFAPLHTHRIQRFMGWVPYFDIAHQGSAPRLTSDEISLVELMIPTFGVDINTVVATVEDNAYKQANSIIDIGNAQMVEMLMRVGLDPEVKMSTLPGAPSRIERAKTRLAETPNDPWRMRVVLALEGRKIRHAFAAARSSMLGAGSPAGVMPIEAMKHVFTIAGYWRTPAQAAEDEKDVDRVDM